MSGESVVVAVEEHSFVWKVWFCSTGFERRRMWCNCSIETMTAPPPYAAAAAIELQLMDYPYWDRNSS